MSCGAQIVKQDFILDFQRQGINFLTFLPALATFAINNQLPIKKTLIHEAF